MIQEDKPDLEDLAHFGTKGMKWGVRKGRAETGVSRAVGAKIDRNNRDAVYIKKTQSRSVASNILHHGPAGAAFIYSNYGQLAMKQRLSDISAQNERFTSGTATRLDKIGASLGTSVAERFISVKPRNQ